MNSDYEECNCVCLCVLWCPAAHAAQGHFAHQLLNDLMENYSNALRPVEDTDKTLNVTLQVTLSQIKDMVSMSKFLCYCIVGDKIFLVLKTRLISEK